MAKKCYRLREQRVICGVCAGVAEYFDIDVLLVRIIWGVCAITVIGLVLYIVAAIALPDR